MASPRIHPSALALALGIAGCAAGAPADSIAQANAACVGGLQHVELRDSGVVIRVLGMRESRTGLHEGFIVRLERNPVRVEDNADITGPIPLHSGEAIVLQGQYECNDGVVHWTHHDPSGRHPAGYVEAGGKRYE